MVYPSRERATLHSYFHSTVPTVQKAVLLLVLQRFTGYVAALPETIPSARPASMPEQA